MENDFPIESAQLHHAYLIAGGVRAREDVQRFLERTLAIRMTGNPDVYVRDYETLGVDDSRELIRQAHLRTIGSHAFLLCSARTVTHEAQNALLKLLEEPPSRTHLFLCTLHPEHLLPTVRSRVVLIDTHTPHVVTHEQSFVTASLRERLSMIETIAAEKDTIAAEKLLNALEDVLHKRSGEASVRQILLHIQNVRRHLNDRGAPLKALLESVALVCP